MSNIIKFMPKVIRGDSYADWVYSTPQAHECPGNDDEAIGLAQEAGLGMLAGEPLTIRGAPIGKATYDFTLVDKSLRQDIELIMMDAIERILDRVHGEPPEAA